MTTNSVGSGTSGAPGARGRLVVAQRGEVARLAQQLLAPDQLAVQRVAHPVDQRQLVGQVGDHRGHVRQPVQPEERRAALEVHQHEVQHLGRVGQRPVPSTSVRSSSDLPEPVAPMTRPCGPMPPCGGLLDVELHRAGRRRRCRSVPAAGPRGARCRHSTARSRPSGRPRRAAWSAWVVGAVGRRRRPAGAAAAAPTAGPARRPPRGQRVGDADRASALGRRSGPGPLPAAVACRPGCTAGRPVMPARSISDDDRPSTRGRRRGPGRAGRVDDDHGGGAAAVRPAATGRSAAGRAGRRRASPPSDAGSGPQPHRPGGVGLGGVHVVRQPLDPLPAHPILGRAHTLIRTSSGEWNIASCAIIARMTPRTASVVALEGRPGRTTAARRRPAGRARCRRRA